MENYARNLEKELIEAGPFENNFSKRVKRWDILFVGDDGKVISVPWLKKIVIGACVICVIFFIILISMFALYGSALSKNSRLLDDIKTVKSRNMALEKDVERLKIMLVGAGTDVKDISSVERKPAQEQVVAPEKKTPSIAVVLPRVEREESQAVPEEIKTVEEKDEDITSSGLIVEEEEDLSIDDSPEDAQHIIGKTEYPESDQTQKPFSVSVEDFTVSRKEINNSIRIRFTIKNVSNDIEPISGNIFVILKSDENGGENLVPIPSVSLVSGKPSEPRKGQFFSIRRFKPVRFIITDRPDYKKFKEATVFVYARSGELVSQTTFPLNL